MMKKLTIIYLTHDKHSSKHKIWPNAIESKMDLILFSLQSLLPQIRKDFKVLHIDDHSSNKSLKLIHESFNLYNIDYDFMQCGDNSGNKIPFMFGLKEALKVNTQYIYLAEDDYLYVPGAINKMLSFMDDKKEKICCTFLDHMENYYQTNENNLAQNYNPSVIKRNKLFYLEPARNTDCPQSNIKNTWQKKKITTSNLIWNKDILQGLIKDIEDINNNEDWFQDRRICKLLSKKNISLYAYVPSLAQHCTINGLSPTF